MMRLWAAYICNQGKIRLNNEDNFCFNGKVAKQIHKNMGSVCQIKTGIRKAVVFSVFDGMGGEQYGETASYIAAKYMKKSICKSNTKIPSDYFRSFCKTVNELIYQKSEELRAERVGTTMAAIYFQYDRAWICNVGDTRIYRMCKGKLKQISHDHTNQEYLEGEGIVGTKPGLTQHLGMNSREYYLNPYIDDVKIQFGDKFLICSDGITDMVSEDEIQAILRAHTSARLCVKELLNKALANGGRDNITAIVCCVR